MMKKITALILCITLTMASVSVFAATGNTENNIYEGKAEYEFLKAVGAIAPDEIDFDAELMISRGLFVKLALHLSNDAPKVLTSNDEIFSDVNNSTEYEAYIETAFKINYISGTTGAGFEPDSIITLSQALKILTNILGYSHVAELSGGYPSGYYTVAQRLNLTRGVSIESNNGLNMSDTMILLYNAANADIMELVSYGDSVGFEAKDGKTLITERHKLDYVEGIINANAYTELYYCDSELEKNQVELDGVIYNVPDSVSSMIGRNVRLWYKTDYEGIVLNAVYAEPAVDSYEITTKSDSIEVDGKTLKVYDEHENSKAYTVDYDVTYIKNNKMSSMTLASLCDVQNGWITLVSNDSDKKIDVIIVNEYKNHVVEGIDSLSGILVCNDGSRFELSDEDCFVKVMKNGENALMSDIKTGDYLLISESEKSGYSYLEILASDEKTVGTFDELADDYVIINNTKYNLSDGFSESIIPGKKYEAGIDAFGQICHVKLDNDVVYGFLFGIKKEGMDKAMCRIFTENNRWVDLYFADKVSYSDGVNYLDKKLTSDELYTLISEMENGGKQLIRYNVNPDGELIKLEVASTHLLGSDGADKACENNIFRLSYDKTATYRSVGTFEGDFYVGVNAKIFVIPSNYDKSLFIVKTRSSFNDADNYAIKAYDVDDMLTSNVIVLDDFDSASVSNTDRFMVVTGKGMKFDSAGDDVPTIRGHRNGKEISLPVEISENAVDIDTYNNIKSGDLIIAKFNKKNNVCNVIKYDTTEKYYISGALWTFCTIICGEVIKKDSSLSRIRLKYSDSGLQTSIMYSASTSVSVWDKSEETFTLANVDEIVPGDIIYANLRTLQANEIVVIRD